MKFLFLCALLLCTVFGAENIDPGRNTLVIIDSEEYQTKYSIFFDDLRSQGFTLKIVTSKESLTISEYGRYYYDNIVLMVSSSKKVLSYGFREFKDFMDNHGNLFVVFDEAVSAFTRNLAGSCGVEIDPDGAKVYDHFAAIKQEGNADHTHFSTGNYCKIPRMVGPLAQKDGHIWYKGMGMTVSEGNVLAVKVLMGGITTYSAASNIVISNFRETSLITSVQSRTNNRITFVGSLEMLSNTMYSKQPDNRVLIKSIADWTFKTTGFVRIRNIEHFKYDEVTNEHATNHEVLVKPVKEPNLPKSHYAHPEVAPNNIVYRIKDEIYYSVTMEEYNGHEWVPYVADDVQVELVMLDPYVRQTLSYNEQSNDGTFYTVIRAPDVYGIYKLRLFYQRQGISLIDRSDQVSIRPFKHNEYPRFILAAYPYYTSVFVVMIGFLAFVFVYLFVGKKDKMD